MKAKYAAAIRHGIFTARAVISRKRVRPKMTPLILVQRGERIPLWERAYHHEITNMVKDGRIKPPKGR